MKQPHFLPVDTNSQKLKLMEIFFVDHVQKWVLPVWSLDFKVAYL